MILGTKKIAWLVIPLFVACSSTKQTTVSEKESSEKAQASVQLSEEDNMKFQYFYVEAIKNRLIGNLESATSQLNACLEINPQSASAMYELANIYTQKRDFTSASLLLQKSIEIEPGNKWAKLLLANIYQSNKEYHKAGKLYDSLMKEYPETLDFYFMNAHTKFAAESFDDAIKIYDQIEKKVGYNENIAFERQKIYLAANDNKKAIKEIERLIDSDPSKPEYIGVLADLYKGIGDMETALEYYKKVLEVDPQNGFVHFSLASYYTQNNMLSEAFDHAKIGFGNSNVDIQTKIQLYLILTNADVQNKLTSEQIELLVLKIVEAHPNEPLSYGIQADFLLNQDRKTEALPFLRKSLELDPNNYPLWEQLILIENELKDYEAMITESDQALEFFPNQPLLYLLKGVAQGQQKAFTESLQTFKTGEAIVVNNPSLSNQFVMHQAEALYSLEQKEESYKLFEKVITNEPNNNMAKNNYAYYLSLDGQNLDKAERLSGDVIRMEPENSTYLDTYAWILFQKGDYQLAKFYQKSALDNNNGNSPVIVEHYGDILSKLEKIEEAIKYWKQSLEMGNPSETLLLKIENKKYIEEKAD